MHRLLGLEFTEDNLKKYKEAWSICNLAGEEMDADTKLKVSDLIEIRLDIKDGGNMDLDEKEKDVKISVILAGYNQGCI